jgi:aminoglycoside phosphotransferase (APT) family kinase protein
VKERPVLDVPADIAAWIESTTGGKVSNTRLVATGGREGYTVDVERGGERLDLFLQIGRPDASFDTSSVDVAKEAEVMRALVSTSVPVPRVWGVEKDRQALLVERAKGRVWMHAPPSKEEQLSVAQDFIRHLASWHRLDPASLELPSFGSVKSVREHQLHNVQHMRALAERGGAPEPLLRISLDFLESNIPDYEGPAVLLQGDTGPGNLMYEDGKVTAVIDWELAHFGDPMEDIAWVTWRATQHTFTYLPDRLKEYEALSGISLDDDRVRYYRVNACIRLASTRSGPWGGFGIPDMGVAKPRPASIAKPTDADLDRAADGSAFIFSILHRRMRLEALMDVLGLPHGAPQEDLEQATAGTHNQMYEDMLARLQAAVRRTGEKMASNTMKGVARNLKFLKEVSRNGRLYEAMERADIAQLLGQRYDDITESRQRLYTAAIDRQIKDEDYVSYHWRRFLRDEQLMRIAAGSIYGRSWAPFR